MTSPTKTFTTPTTQIPFEVYEWITGRKSEYIQEPILSAVKIGGSMANLADGKPEISMGDRTTSAVQDSNRREVESYIAKVGEEVDPKKCIELILDMPESDYEFVQKCIAEVKEASKKK